MLTVGVYEDELLRWSTALNTTTAESKIRQSSSYVSADVSADILPNSAGNGSPITRP